MPGKPILDGEIDSPPTTSRTPAPSAGVYIPPDTYDPTDVSGRGWGKPVDPQVTQPGAPTAQTSPIAAGANIGGFGATGGFVPPVNTYAQPLFASSSGKSVTTAFKMNPIILIVVGIALFLWMKK